MKREKLEHMSSVSDNSESDPENENSLDGSTFFFWNDWVPQTRGNSTKVEIRRSEFQKSKSPLWIPPGNFRKQIRSRKDKLGQKYHPNVTEDLEKSRSQVDDLLHNNLEESLKKDERPNSQQRSRMRHISSITEWGPRLPSGSSLFLLDNGALLWDYFNPGCFGVLKMWKNDLTPIECFGEAEFKNSTTTEDAILILNQEIHLRKLLGVNLRQWNALKDTLSTGKWHLTYQALSKNKQMANCSSVEKLWYFLCKRRHYLPTVIVRMRRAGIKRLPMKILPKFIMTDIRDFNGDDIT